MKKKINLILSKKTFRDEKQMTIRNWIILSVLIALTTLCLFFLVSLSSNGFSEIQLMWRINKNLLIIIPIAAIGLGAGSFIVQQISNNRLADTSVLGIGNINLIALMILILSVDFNSSYSISNYKNGYPFIFIIVSMLTSLVIYSISYNKRANISKKFVISGIILNFTFVAISYSINSLLPGGKAAAIKAFANGFIDSADPLPMYVALVGFIIGIIWLAFIYEKLKICTVSNDVARELGINSNSIYLQALLIAGLFTGVSYTLVGNIVFLGLIAANITYNIYKKNFNFAIPCVSLISTLILTFVFVINKNILLSEINTASIIPLAGIPYFLYLVFKE